MNVLTCLLLIAIGSCLGLFLICLIYWNILKTVNQSFIELTKDKQNKNEGDL
jgi:hypothetical protein